MFERLRFSFGRQEKSPISPHPLSVGDNVFYEDPVGGERSWAFGEVISIDDMKTEVRILGRFQNYQRVDPKSNNHLIVKTGDDRLHKVVFNQSSSQDA